MWPAFDLVNRGAFMELGSPRLIRGVPGTEGPHRCSKNHEQILVGPE